MTSFVFTAFWYVTLVPLMNSVATNVHCVTKNNTDDSNSNTLFHYINNSEKYFTSYSQLIFFPGDYQDLIFEDIRNFTMTAIDSCKIYCSLNVSIIVVNVTYFELKNISLVNCGKNCTNFNCNSSILLYDCALVRIISVNISTNAYVGGILAMNVKKRFMIDSVKVQLECLGNHKFDHTIHEILLRYNNYNKTGNDNTNVTLHNFNYKVNGPCVHFSRYAIMVRLAQTIAKYNVNVTVKDTKFQNLNYSSVLYYYMLSCKFRAVNFIYIRNVTVFNNSGDYTCAMFYIKLFNQCVQKV